MFEKEMIRLSTAINSAKDKWLLEALKTHGIELSEAPTVEDFRQYKDRIELQINLDIDPKCENLFVDGKLVGKWYQAEINHEDSMIAYTNKYWIAEENK